MRLRQGGHDPEQSPEVRTENLRDAPKEARQGKQAPEGSSGEAVPTQCVGRVWAERLCRLRLESEGCEGEGGEVWKIPARAVTDGSPDAATDARSGRSG